MLRFLLLFFCFCVCNILFIYAQELDTTMWQPNGEVHTVLQHEDILYVGGSFDYIGPPTGSCVEVNQTNGEIKNGFPLIEGGVSTVVSDGNGGWFLGGNISEVDGKAIKYTGIIHITSTKQLDLSWNVVTDGRVNSIIVSDSNVYFSGSFTKVNNVEREGLAAVNITTGTLNTWNPAFMPGVNSIVKRNNIIYVGGNFKRFRGNETLFENLAAIDAISGKTLDWGFKTDGEVTKLVLDSNRLYLVGYFKYINSLQSCCERRQYIASIDLNSNRLLSWKPEPNTTTSYSKTINDLFISADTVYLVGSFNSINNVPRHGIAAVDAITGVLTSFNPNTEPHEGTFNPGFIYISGDIAYIGGKFESIANVKRHNVAAILLSSGQVTTWNPSAGSFVNCILPFNNSILLGGSFTSIGGAARKNLAAINLTTKRATSWSPTVKSRFISRVKALAIVGNTIFLGGIFESINNQRRDNIAALDIITGDLKPWGYKLGTIYTIKAFENTIFVGGEAGLTVIDAISGRVNEQWDDVWKDVGPGLYCPVNTITFHKGVLYAGGHFNFAGGKERHNMAAFDMITGKVIDWNPDVDNMVKTSVILNDTLYIGGDFTKVGDKGRNYIASVDINSGVATSWQPNFDKAVSNIALLDNVLYSSGSYTTVNGKIRKGLSSMYLSTGELTSWDPITENSLFTAPGNIYISNKIIYSFGSYNTLLAFKNREKENKNYIRGEIFIDENKDCKKDSSENSLGNVIIAAEPGPYYGYTDAQGKYSIAVDTGTYTVKQILPNGQGKLITQLCPPNGGSHTVNFKTYNDTIQDINFANQVTLCPNLTIAVSSDRRRRCLTSRTLLSYANIGFASAANVKVHVKFPAYVVPVSASKAYTITADSVYVFDIGTLEANQSGVITIIDSVLCGIPSIRGLTQCTKAWITPANTCLPTDPKWDKSDISLQASCKDNGVVRIAIYNQGQGHMADSSSFRIYADAILVFKHSYKLSAGDSLILQVPANGQTIRLEADQRPYHPKEQTTTITIEACGKNASGKVSMGFVTQLPIESESPEVAMECLPIIDSYDPNDKLVVPQGTTMSRYTPTGKALNYTIRFQNTGTDTAYKVIVVDTLDANLDVSTFKVKAASHPYQLSVSGKGRPVLTLTFNNINLPDSNRNEALSHGYIKFTITPHTAIAQGTVIENHADIFFDYNPAIRTNTVTNTIFDVTQSIPVGKEAKVIVCSQAIDPFAGENRFVCAQDTVVLQGVAPDFGTGTWHLLKGSGKIQETHNPNSLITGLGYGENVFEWRAPANTCTSDSLTSQVAITNLVLPLVKAVGSGSICGEGSVKLVAHGASGYKWYSSLSATEAISTDSVFTTPVLSQSTTYYVAAVEYACEGPRIAIQAQIQPFPPTPIISQISTDSLHCSTQASSYEWFLDGVALKVNTQSIKVNQAGAYTVKAITNACASLLSEAYTYEVLPTGMVEESTLHVKIYPNPSPGRFALYIDLKNEKQVKVTIYNTFGREVYTNKLETTSGSINKEIDCSALGKGLFIVKVQSKSGTLIEKLLIQ